MAGRPMSRDGSRTRAEFSAQIFSERERRDHAGADSSEHCPSTHAWADRQIEQHCTEMHSGHQGASSLDKASSRKRISRAAGRWTRAQSGRARAAPLCARRRAPRRGLAGRWGAACAGRVVLGVGPACGRSASLLAPPAAPAACA